MLNRINKIIKTKKFFIIFLIIIIIGSFLITKPREKPNETSNITTTPIPATISITFEKISTPKDTYLINAIVNSKTPVNGFSWTENDLIFYSTPNGIYEATNNQPLISDKIDYISWSSNGVALYKSNNLWKVFENKAEKPYTLNLNFNNPTISPDGKSLIYRQANDLIIFSLDTNTSRKKTMSGTITKLLWAPDSQFFGVSLKLTNKNNIIIFDSNLKEVSNLNFGINTEFLSLSPNAKSVFVKDENKLIIYDIQSEKETILEFKPNSSLTTLSLDVEKVILIESTKDNLKRQLDEFYLINTTNNEKRFLANSLIITNKLNLNLIPKLTKNRDVLLFSENNGRLWMLSLIPNTLPTFSNDGLHLTKFITRGHN